jgi:uncharacterized protein (DUF2164 family)
MIRLIFFGLFMMALIAGVYFYYESSPKYISPLKYVMDYSGFTDLQTVNRKKTQETNVTTRAGIMQIRKQLDDLAVVQNNVFDTIQDQQQRLKTAGKDASDVLLEAKKEGGVRNKDILQLEALASQIQDERRLSVARGEDLIALNDEITQKRRWISEQIDRTNIYTGTELGLLQKRSLMLRADAVDFLDKTNAYNQEMRDAMARIQGKLQVLDNRTYDNRAQVKMIKGRIQDMLNKEHEDMIKLESSHERSKDQMRDVQQNLAATQERLNDLQQHTKDLVEFERQKQEDQQSMIRQRIADHQNR